MRIGRLDINSILEQALTEMSDTFTSFDENKRAVDLGMHDSVSKKLFKLATIEKTIKLINEQNISINDLILSLIHQSFYCNLRRNETSAI